MRTFLKGLLPLALFSLMAAGCDSNPTNEPSKSEIDEANAARAAAIDNDPSITPEGKKKMKEMMHLNGASSPGAEGRK